MADLWRYELTSNQWEQVEVYGIANITRNLYLWNGTYVTLDVETKDRLAEDKNNTIRQQQMGDPKLDANIRLPTP